MFIFRKVWIFVIQLTTLISGVTRAQDSCYSDGVTSAASSDTPVIYDACSSLSGHKLRNNREYTIRLLDDGDCSCTIQGLSDMNIRDQDKSCIRSKQSGGKGSRRTHTIAAYSNCAGTAQNTTDCKVKDIRFRTSGNDAEIVRCGRENPAKSRDAYTGPYQLLGTPNDKQPCVCTLEVAADSQLMVYVQGACVQVDMQCMSPTCTYKYSIGRYTVSDKANVTVMLSNTCEENEMCKRTYFAYKGSVQATCDALPSVTNALPSVTNALPSVTTPSMLDDKQATTIGLSLGIVAALLIGLLIGCYVRKYKREPPATSKQVTKPEVSPRDPHKGAYVDPSEINARPMRPPVNSGAPSDRQNTYLEVVGDYPAYESLHEEQLASQSAVAKPGNTNYQKRDTNPYQSVGPAHNSGNASMLENTNYEKFEEDEDNTDYQNVTPRGVTPRTVTPRGVAPS